MLLPGEPPEGSTAASLGSFANPTPKYPEVYSASIGLSNKDQQTYMRQITLKLASHE
jgi:hypothetical protein